MKPSVVLVTGGAGFVGSSLAMHLRRTLPSARVIALDNLKRRGSELNLPRLRAAGVEFVHGDIRNPEDLELDTAPELVLECSAEPSVMAGYGSSPSYVLHTNLVGTLHLLELCRRTGAAMLFLSTSRVYPMSAIEKIRLLETETRFEIDPSQQMQGLSAEGISEQFPLDGARSLYGATKLASELFLHEYAHAYGLPVLINRCGVLAGPWQMGKVDQGVLSLWVARHFYGGALSYVGFGGTGKQVRDVLHIADLCELVSLQIERFAELQGEVFNVGGGRKGSVSLLELTALCQRIGGRSIPMQSVPETRVADIPVYLTDNAKLTRTTGWVPSRSVETLVADTFEWIRANEADLRPILHPDAAPLR